MNARKGYVLIALLLFFTVLGMSSTVAVLEQDTRLKRFSEEDLKLNLDALRRGIDLYRYRYTYSTPNTAKISALDAAMQAGPNQLADLLAGESFIRARVATGTMQWRIIDNQIKNPSFEIDDNTDYGLIGTWRGNYTANDGVPNGWKLNAQGAEQCINITNAATYVVSFWARCTTATAKARLKIWAGGATPSLELLADKTEWKRYFGSFAVTSAPAVIKIEILQAGTVVGDTTYIDGLMLEKWVPPPGMAGGSMPVASAWTDKYQVVPTQAVTALQERAFKSELTAPTDVSSYSWWFQW